MYEVIGKKISLTLLPLDGREKSPPKMLTLPKADLDNTATVKLQPPGPCMNLFVYLPEKLLLEVPDAVVVNQVQDVCPWVGVVATRGGGDNNT